MDFGTAKLTSVDLRGSQLDGIKLDAAQLHGLTIDPLQALAVVQIFGVKIG
jgi:hypothetical protein